MDNLTQIFLAYLVDPFNWACTSVPCWQWERDRAGDIFCKSIIYQSRLSLAYHGAGREAHRSGLHFVVGYYCLQPPSFLLWDHLGDWMGTVNTRCFERLRWAQTRAIPSSGKLLVWSDVMCPVDLTNTGYSANCSIYRATAPSCVVRSPAFGDSSCLCRSSARQTRSALSSRDSVSFAMDGNSLHGFGFKFESLAFKNQR